MRWGGGPRNARAKKLCTHLSGKKEEAQQWGPSTRKGGAVEKFVPSLESLFSFGFEAGELGCPRDFAGMSRTAAGVNKLVQKKSMLIFRPLLFRRPDSVYQNVWVLLGHLIFLLIPNLHPTERTGSCLPPCCQTSPARNP